MSFDYIFVSITHTHSLNHSVTHLITHHLLNHSVCHWITQSLTHPNCDWGLLWSHGKRLHSRCFPSFSVFHCAYHGCALYSLADLFNRRPSWLLWEAFSHAAILRRLLVHKYSSLSIARYSFIQLSELEQCRVKKLAQGFTWQHRIRTWVLLVESPMLYPWATVLLLCRLSCLVLSQGLSLLSSAFFALYLSLKDILAGGSAVRRYVQTRRTCGTQLLTAKASDLSHKKNVLADIIIMVIGLIKLQMPWYSCATLEGVDSNDWLLVNMQNIKNKLKRIKNNYIIIHKIIFV